jgi:hypothetical protein
MTRAWCSRSQGAWTVREFSRYDERFYQEVKPKLGSNLNEAPAGSLLLCNSDSGRILFHLLHAFGDLPKDDVDVSRLASVLPNAAVGSVGPSASGGGPVALGMVDNELLDVKVLGLGIGHRVLDQVEVHLHGLDREAALVTGRLGLLGQTLAADAASVPNEGDDGLELENVLEDRDRLADLHPACVLGDLAAMLVVDSQVRPFGLGGLFRLRIDAVGNHTTFNSSDE